MTGPRERQLGGHILFPRHLQCSLRQSWGEDRGLRRNKTLCFLWGRPLGVGCWVKYLPTKKKNCKIFSAWRRMAHKFTTVSRCATWSCETFHDMWNILFQSENVFELGRITIFIVFFISLIGLGLQWFKFVGWSNWKQSQQYVFMGC